MFTFARGLFVFCSAAIGTHAMAQTASALPLWEVGGVGFGVSQQAYPGSDQQVNRALVLPYFLYRGEFFRADRDSAGIRALKTENYEIDIGVAGAFGAGSKALEARKGMRELGTLVEVGPRLKWNLSTAFGTSLGTSPGGGRLRAEIPLRAVFDLSDKGEYRGWSFEPRLTYEAQSSGGWRYNASVGAVFADTKLAQTLYEVSASEATPARAAYAAKSGLVAWRLGTSVSRSLDKDWSVFGFARLDTVAGAANEASPLVRKTAGGTVGVGLAYTWMRSERRAQD
jgi:MipA family protein